MNNQCTFLSVLLLLFFIASCQPEEEFCDDPADRTCPNYDPCTAVPPANSDFEFVAKIENPFADTVIDLVVTEAYGGARINYKATTTGLTTYEWRVGNDPRTFSGEEMYLDFLGFSGDIPVSLRTTSTNLDDCLTEDQLVAEHTKTITYVELSAPPAIDGTFKGEIVGAIDDQEYEISISNPRPPYRRMFGLPVPADCDFRDRGVPLYSGYQVFVSTFLQESGTPDCRNLVVVGRIDHNDSDVLHIEYVYDDDDGSRKTVVFEGRRQ